MRIYVENIDLLDELGWYSTPLQLKEQCRKAGLYFSQDDMGECYVYQTEDCHEFDAVEV